MRHGHEFGLRFSVSNGFLWRALCLA